MAWFLPRFEGVLADPESAWGDWQAEYSRVSFLLLSTWLVPVLGPPRVGLNDRPSCPLPPTHVHNPPRAPWTGGQRV
jgi:hypothetical protein